MMMIVMMMMMIMTTVMIVVMMMPQGFAFFLDLGSLLNRFSVRGVTGGAASSADMSTAATSFLKLS